METSTPQPESPSVRTSWIDLGAHRVSLSLISPEVREEYGMEEGDRGLWDPLKMAITIVRTGKSQDLQVLFHEILHAIVYFSGWPVCGEADLEEKMCDILGERFAELFLRNPTVLEEWL